MRTLGGLIMNNILKEKKKLYDCMYKTLKEELNHEKLVEGQVNFILLNSVRLCDILRHNSYKNYVKLNSIDPNTYYYKRVELYSKKYENITKALYNKIINRNNDRELIVVNSYIKESIKRLNNKNSDFIKRK